MKHKRTLACMLAALLCALPFAACAAPESGGTDLPPSAEQDPPVFEPLPEAPETPEEPALPEVPEEPAEPETPEEPTVPEAPDEPTVPEQPAPPAVEVPPAELEPPVPQKSEYVKVLTNGLNVRKGAGTNYASLGTVQSEILLHFIEKDGGWYKTYYRGQFAYVSAGVQFTKIATLEKGKPAVESVIAEGLKYMGVPYVYGAVRYHDGKGNKLKGFTESKFDCSSLMQYIFFKGANVLLDVTTRTQVLQGTEVKKADMQRGDLMFFTNESRKNNTGVERIGHVALYLGGNYILHTASDFAKVELISATRWSYFITAKRVL